MRGTARRVTRDYRTEDRQGPGNADLSHSRGDAPDAVFIQKDAAFSHDKTQAAGDRAPRALEQSGILIIDDDAAIGRFLVGALGDAGYLCEWAADGLEALTRLEASSYHLVICDIRLPGMDGLEILKRVKEHDPDMAFIVLTACPDVSVAVPALKLGAQDYLVKPVHFEKLLISVQRALEHRSLELENRFYQQDLEKKVRQRTQELLQKHREFSNLIMNSIGSLVSTIEAKDTYTEGHSWKVAMLSANLGKQLTLDTDTLESLLLSGLLHDIGKIGIEDAILNKPGKLTEQEFDKIRQHPVIGERILEPLIPLKNLLPCVRNHHEWFDGHGYPDGLVGHKIPLEARILTIADAYDAIMSNRAYRMAKSHHEALQIIEDCSGTQFDPEIAAAFIGMRR